MASNTHALHPHLLGTEDLRSYLKQRCLNVPDLADMERPQLMQIFQRFAVPRSQRNSRKPSSPKSLNQTLAQSRNQPQLGIAGEADKLMERTKHKRIEPPQLSDPVDVVMEDMSIVAMTEHCQQIRITGSRSYSDAFRKRPMMFSCGNSEADRAVPVKRKPIAWP